ncbi:MAG: DNA-directed RNA polymerase subunit omega [Phycisphaerae bacterium]|jgi:DNA-directed RNA polymerase subunit omega|nr:DNA-directed RNA polymerase subunit omega [Phycisphaerae bacterium]
MIESLKDDKIISMAGGRFKLTALMQKRWLQLMNGARPMVDPAGKTDLEIITQEILEGKIVPDFTPQVPAAAGEETASDSDAE